MDRKHHEGFGASVADTGMKTVANFSEEDRRAVFEEAGSRLGLSPRAVEKDFWVCWTLDHLFALPGVGEHLTFKGGTSLSKVWKLIKRFSEDIDIIVDRTHLGFGGDESPESAPSRKQRQVRLAALKQACQERVQHVMLPGLEGAFRASLTMGESWNLTADAHDPDQQTLLFAYPSVWQDGGSSYLRREVKIEMGARSDDWPAKSAVIQPYAAEILPQVFTKSEIQVRALEAERTFWEKATLLHEENFRPPAKQRKS